ncbi:GTPase-activating protein [Borealophlyctis nickersoniae]|nr:GTPase-activating protein [Borealophlyctis nickersoniae]
MTDTATATAADVAGTQLENIPKTGSPTRVDIPEEDITVGVETDAGISGGGEAKVDRQDEGKAAGASAKTRRASLPSGGHREVNIEEESAGLNGKPPSVITNTSKSRSDLSTSPTKSYGHSSASKPALSAFMGHPKHRRRPSSGSLTGLFVQRPSDRPPSVKSVESDSSAPPQADTTLPTTESPSPTSEPAPSRPTSIPVKRISTASVDDMSGPNTPANGYASGDDSEFLLARLEEQGRSQTPVQEGAPKKSSGYWPSAYLQASFQAVKESLTGEGKPVDEEEIDWDFWGKVMNDYEATARRHPRTFTRKLQLGIPDAIRGMVWQLMCKGKSPDLEIQYAHLLTRTSTHEKIIQRDLSRTFPKHERFMEVGGPGQESLFNVIKAYSLYDPEIGYCQGIAFIVGPLLLNMPDEEAFCVLVRLMKDYNLRELYTPQMVGLQLRLYQFDKIVEEQFPAVHKHLEAQDIKSTMYASQWFMTMFAYRFPLPIVFRIMDIIFAEGVDAMLRFALALIKRNADHILTLDFEPLLEFLKNGLFDAYGGSVSALIVDASAVRLTKHRLDKLATEFADIMRKTSPEAREVARLEIDNRRLVETVRRMEGEYEQLNREHIDLANRLLDTRVRSDQYADQVETLGNLVAQLKQEVENARKAKEAEVQEEMERLAMKNLELTRRNAELVEECCVLQDVLEDTKLRFAECENERGELVRKWNGLKKAMGSSERLA